MRSCGMAQGPPEWSEARRQIELREASLIVAINDALVKGESVTIKDKADLQHLLDALESLKLRRHGL